jgi:hypothetical protein
MKSIPISSHFHLGTFNGCSSPAGLWCSALTLSQTSHTTTCAATSLFSPYHQYFLLQILIQLSTTRMSRVIRVMGFLQYSLTEAVNLRNTYLVLEPYCALFILRKFWTSTFSNQIFDLLDFSIIDLSFADFLLQGRFYFNSDPFSVRNYSQVESSKIFY